MMDYSLPTSFVVGDAELMIRNKGDYRAVLDVIAALKDPDLTDNEKLYCALQIFYENPEDITDTEEAFKKLAFFINAGEEEQGKSNTPPLMDWEQDFKLIVSPVNRILGTEIRALPYLHWWSFISAYYEIGDCSFASVVSIRKKLKTGKPLEKWEREFYRGNKSTIDLRQRLSSEEQELIDSILGS